MLIPRPTAIQYRTAATIRLVQLNENRAATACTWNHASTTHVTRLSFEYRDSSGTATMLLNSGLLLEDGHQYGSKPSTRRL